MGTSLASCVSATQRVLTAAAQRVAARNSWLRDRVWPSTDDALVRRRDGTLAIDAMFRVVIGRHPDPAERAELLRRAKDGAGFDDLIAELRTSREALDLAAARASRLLRDLLERDLEAEATDVAEPPARVVFLHIMKTGGTSLSDLMRTWAGPTRSRLSLPLDDLIVMPRPQLARLNAISGHLPFESLGLVPGRFSTVTVLRDPVERTVSHYRELLRTGPHPDLSLDEFVSSEVYDVPAGNYLARALAHSVDMADAWVGYSPRQLYLQAGGTPDQPYPLQALFDSTPIVCGDDQLLKTAAQNLAQIDIVGVTEALDQVADRVGARFGASRLALPRLNVSARSGPDELPDHIRKRIELRTEVDLELYRQALDMSK